MSVSSLSLALFRPLLRSLSVTAQPHLRPLPSPTPPSTSITHTTPTTAVTSPLVDSFNRPHTYLRLSLTEKCNLRCVYCMPDTTPDPQPPPTHLTAAELERLTRVFATHGVTKVRLTGGEPLLRPDLIPIAQSLSNISGIRTLALTTNAVTLHRHLVPLVDAGLSAINISLDTLVPARFELLTKRRGHARVLAAIDDSVAAGLATRVNAVVMRNVNDDELADFARLTENRPIDVRFIEYMPFDGNRWASTKFLSYAAMLQSIAKHFGRLEHVTTEKSDTTKYYRVPGFRGRIGFITSMTDHFCAGCNRLRVTADGNLKVCLFGNDEVSLRDVMRAGGSDADVESVVRQALGDKHFSLGGNADMFDISKSDNRSMVRIGG